MKFEVRSEPSNNEDLGSIQVRKKGFPVKKNQNSPSLHPIPSVSKTAKDPCKTSTAHCSPSNTPQYHLELSISQQTTRRFRGPQISRRGIVGCKGYRILEDLKYMLFSKKRNCF